MQLRPGHQRGHADHGWLDTRHTFSFADYYDPRYMGFGHLRVINEDRVEPGAGFGAHAHRNMEIVSYVVSGALAHRDTTGGGGVLHHGDVQVMSAGRGVAHSEMNGSNDEPVHFLQIWVLPREANTTPRYADRHFPLTDRGLTLLVSPDGRDGSLPIGQDVELWRALLDAGETRTVPLRHGQGWVQVVSGELVVSGALLRAGDGVAVKDSDHLALEAREGTEALLFDLR